MRWVSPGRVEAVQPLGTVKPKPPTWSGTACTVRGRFMQVEEYFRGKGCVVTGAASGIGFALTEALLQAGAVVFMADRDTQTLTSAVEQLSTYAGRVHSMAVDVTNQEQVQHMVEEAASRHGRLDVLFNNAGIGCTHPD